MRFKELFNAKPLPPVLIKNHSELQLRVMVTLKTYDYMRRNLDQLSLLFIWARVTSLFQKCDLSMVCTDSESARIAARGIPEQITSRFWE